MTREQTASALKYGTIGLLVAAIVVPLFWRSGGTRKDTRQLYYFDESSGRVFVGPASEIPPITAPSQEGGADPAGVRAYIFACESCAPTYDGMTLEEVQQHGGFVAWFEKYTPEGQRLLAEGKGLQEGVELETGNKHELIRAPNNERWVPSESRPANMIRSILRSRCGDGSPRMCQPSSQ